MGRFWVFPWPQGSPFPYATSLALGHLDGYGHLTPAKLVESWLHLFLLHISLVANEVYIQVSVDAQIG